VERSVDWRGAVSQTSMPIRKLPQRLLSSAS
jgi:hypothetical protein